MTNLTMFDMFNDSMSEELTAVSVLTEFLDRKSTCVLRTSLTALSAWSVIYLNNSQK